MRRTAGCEVKTSPIGPAAPGPCVTTLSTPSGNPASEKTSLQIVPPTIGDHSDGLRTTVLPSASGAAIERAERMSAAFHGAIAATTPTGLRIPIENAAVSDGMTVPIGWYGNAAA